MVCPYTLSVNLLGLLFKQLIQHTFQGPHHGHWVSEAILCPHYDCPPQALQAGRPIGLFCRWSWMTCNTNTCQAVQ